MMALKKTSGFILWIVIAACLCAGSVLMDIGGMTGNLYNGQYALGGIGVAGCFSVTTTSFLCTVGIAMILTSVSAVAIARSTKILLGKGND